MAPADPNYAWTVLFQSLRQDTVTGNYYARNRNYSPTLGRWTTRDPIGYEASDVNLYRMVKNTPTSRLDPSGLEDFKFLEPGLGIIENGKATSWSRADFEKKCETQDDNFRPGKFGPTAS